MATVQDGNGQEIEDGEIYIDENHKPKKLLKSDFGKYAEMINDSNGTTHVSKFHI